MLSDFMGFIARTEYRQIKKSLHRGKLRGAKDEVCIVVLGMDDLLTYENFYLAFKRLQTVPMSYYKELYIGDLKNFGLELDSNIESVIHFIKGGLYRPSHVNKLYIPKTTGLVRPISVLNFLDLLVYQAIVNLVAQAFNSELKPLYNEFVFGNLYNDAEDEKKIFFYQKWQEQWKKYEEKGIELFENGYHYISDFDLASFYDTVDHYLLHQVLSQKLDISVVSLLMNQLTTWTMDSERNNLSIMHGIPQGPPPSAYLSEICLMQVDIAMKKKVFGERDVVYIRYADDIRLFTKDSVTARRYISYLDILVRDFGLIPQANKIATNHIHDRAELYKNRNHFSTMAMEYRIKGTLSKRHNTRLTKKLKETIQSETYDKTILRFSLYRIEADDEVKNLLLTHSDKLVAHFESVCFYLSKHYQECSDVKQWATNILKNRNVVFHYQLAMIFKYFHKVIDFDQDIFRVLFQSDVNRHWYVRYYMLDWIESQLPERLLLLSEDKNPLVNRKLKEKKVRITQSVENKLDLIMQMLASSDVQEALAGWRMLLYDFPEHYYFNYKLDNVTNDFVRNILSMDNLSSYLTTLLENKGISRPNVFYCKKFWPDDEYEALMDKYIKADKISGIDPSSWLLYMDTFNHLVSCKILQIFNINVPNLKEYGTVLEIEGFLKKHFPIMYRNFQAIHNRRNETPPAHPYTKDGKLSIGLSFYDLAIFNQLEIEALQDLVQRFEFVLASYQRVSSKEVDVV
jgi:hypothetical protein